jgi:hypothetical protein
MELERGQANESRDLARGFVNLLFNQSQAM